MLLSVVIPARNEEAALPATVSAVEAALRREGIPHEIVVVNDASTDGTPEVLRKLSAEFDTVRAVTQPPPHNGFGLAVRCGLRASQGAFVAVLMADGSDDPEDLVAYYRRLQTGVDCVFGSRFVPGGRLIDYPPHKLVLNRLANWLVMVLFGLRLNDTTNAFKAYRREVVEAMAPLISKHFNLTVEMPLKAIVRGYSYEVIPISWRNRKSGVSKLKLQEMGSRYLFIVLYLLLEKWLSCGDYYRPVASPAAADRAGKGPAAAQG
ncbi:MAG: glycosyltransferase family 2 protein [Planctomycetes bacterium]|nr:glycosyltransferase family 2 protein [Planctomycetota bacterium]